MKNLALLLTATLLSLTSPAFANHDGKDHADHAEMPMSHEEASTNEVAVTSGDAHVSVNGLVCDFCARALEKTFGKKDEVKGIDVNLETKIVTINFNDGQTLDDATLTQIITDSGYNVEGIHRVK